MRKIQRKDVINLLGLFRHGLVGGAGSTVTEFCVQQAVHRVIDGDLKAADKSDSPPDWCVHVSLRGFGIGLNDSEWDSEKSRAKGLAKFAIAELGSANISFREFATGLKSRLLALNGGQKFEGYGFLEWSVTMSTCGLTNDQLLTRYANTAAEVLKKMGTEGGKWIHLVDEPSKRRRRAAARKLSAAAWEKLDADWKKRRIQHRLGKPYSSGMASTSTSFGRTPPVTKVPLH